MPKPCGAHSPQSLQVYALGLVVIVRVTMRGSGGGGCFSSVFEFVCMFWLQVVGDRNATLCLSRLKRNTPL